MSNVAHMPAHKALNIDSFHDAAVKVGMYKNAVTAFMHPYTLGALETSIRKTGGTLQGGGINLSYRGVKLISQTNWSKNDVTFCVEWTAGIKDAVARGAVAKNDVNPIADEIEAATVNDVTGELELSKARQEVDIKVNVHGATEAVSQLGTLTAAALAAKNAIRALDLRSQAGELLMDAANNLLDRARKLEESQATVTVSGLVTPSRVDCGQSVQGVVTGVTHDCTTGAAHVDMALTMAGEPAAVGAAIQKVLNAPVKPSEEALKASEAIRRALDKNKAAGKRY